MRWLASIPLLAGLSYALPQDGCSTATTEVIVPTRTATYTETPVVTEHETGVKDLGTFTLVTTVSSTRTLETITTTIGACEGTGTVTVPAATETLYSGGPSVVPAGKRALGLSRRDCTVTVTATTTYGQTQVYVTANTTRTYSDYTAFTQHTVTSTKYGGSAYAIATGTTTTPSACGGATVTPTSYTTTVTLDARCSPSAMTSAYSNFGLEYLDDTPTGGATYNTNTPDASACCQLCAEADSCAASAWDIRSGSCRLEFPVDVESGEMNCGEGLLAFYDAGPDHPMSPGTGWYVAPMCGNVQFGSAKPDDGT